VQEPKTPSCVAQEAFECWEAGKLVKAVELYTQAIELCNRSNLRLPTYLAELASVLATLGQIERSIHFFQESLNVELEQGEPEESSAVVLARYFLSDQLVRAHRYEDALAILRLANRDNEIAWLVWTVESLALSPLGRTSEALTSAKMAIVLAPSEEKKAELTSILSVILSNS
jgi:tetratricopeptide (TPR) repeat protein